MKMMKKRWISLLLILVLVMAAGCGKKNTTIDEHYYRQAENQLYAELGIALGKNQEDVFGLIAEACRA